MPFLEPLPFRIAVPGEDKLDSRGARSISWRIEGLLHHEDTRLVFEWGGVRKVESVSLTHAVDRSEPLEPEVLEVPIEWIAEAWLEGWLWLPTLVLRARRLEAFDGLPGAVGGRAVLRIRRRYLPLARLIVREINR